VAAFAIREAHAMEDLARRGEVEGDDAIGGDDDDAVHPDIMPRPLARIRRPLAFCLLVARRAQCEICRDAEARPVAHRRAARPLRLLPHRPAPGALRGDERSAALRRALQHLPRAERTRRRPRWPGPRSEAPRLCEPRLADLS